MYRENQIVEIDGVGMGWITEVHAHVCKVRYYLLGFEYNEFYANSDLTPIGQIGYEEE